MSIISSDNLFAVWAVITVCVALSIYLEKHYSWAAKVSALILVLLFSIILSNIRVMPTDSPVYDSVWDYLVPLALPMLLFRVDLKKIIKESGQLLAAFLLGALGTMAGALVAAFVFKKYIPELAGVSAMLTGTYIGGSVNMMALADSFGVSSDMVSAATIADDLNMAIYFFVLLAIPVRIKASKQEAIKKREKTEGFSLISIAVCIAAAFFIVAVSNSVAGFFSDLIHPSSAVLTIFSSLLGNKYLWITTVTVTAATVFPKFFASIEGGQEFGTFIIYIFMFVIGAHASVRLIIQKSPLLLIFAMIIVIFNMIFTFAGGKIFHMDREILIVASNANIGGPTTAASMAIARGWNDLVGPALLIGSFGYVIGNYLGIMVGYLTGMF